MSLFYNQAPQKHLFNSYLTNGGCCLCSFCYDSQQNSKEQCLSNNKSVKVIGLGDAVTYHLLHLFVKIS